MARKPRRLLMTSGRVNIVAPIDTVKAWHEAAANNGQTLSEWLRAAARMAMAGVAR